jgi:transposase
MRKDLQRLYDSLDTISSEELRSSLRAVLMEYSDLLDLSGEKERISTEMAIQFSKMKVRLSGAEKENGLLKKENLRLTEQLNLRKKELFGRASEKTSGIFGTALSDEVYEDPLSEDLVSREMSADASCCRIGLVESGNKHRNGNKQKGKRTKDLSGVPKKTEFLLDIDELDRIYGSGNWRIFNWTRYEEYISVPCTTYLKVTYAPVLSVGLEHCLVRSPYKGKLLPGSLVSASILAEIMYDKFVLGLPLYRQEQHLLRNGVILTRQDMVNWITRFALDLFGPVYDRLAFLLRLCRYNQVDETTLEVIMDGRKAGSKSYMWVHTTSELFEGNPIVVFGYELTRSTDHLRDFYLKNGYHGMITSDSYVSYSLLEEESDGEITGTRCFMHCRRRFVVANLVCNLKGLSPETVKQLPEYRSQSLIDEIFDAETPLKGLPEQERMERRNTEVRPKVDAFFDYLHSLDMDDPSYSDRLREAVSYSLHQETHLRMFLEDASIPMDNGHCERKIRPFAVGRSNWLFSYSLTGAEVMAIIFTLVETAKANQAHPYYYLMYLLQKMPSHMEETCLDFLDDMMPWSETYRTYEKNSKEETFRYCSDQEPVILPKTPRKKDRAS